MADILMGLLLLFSLIPIGKKSYRVELTLLEKVYMGVILLFCIIYFAFLRNFVI